MTLFNTRAEFPTFETYFIQCYRLAHDANKEEIGKDSQVRCGPSPYLLRSPPAAPAAIYWLWRSAGACCPSKRHPLALLSRQKYLPNPAVQSEAAGAPHPSHLRHHLRVEHERLVPCGHHLHHELPRRGFLAAILNRRQLGPELSASLTAA
jgi:hypothetical protein